jgi:hypothetical protein
MALQLKVVLTMSRLRSPRAQSIEVLSQCEEVRLACQSLMMFMLAQSRVIVGKISQPRDVSLWQEPDLTQCVE